MPSPAAPSGHQRKQPGNGRQAGRTLIWLLLLILLAGGGYLYLSRGKSSAAEGGRRSGQPQVTSVAVAPAAQKDVNVYLNGLGTVSPLNTVTVRTRVDGQLMDVFFREGQVVKQGSLLATIDPRPYEVQLTQAQGQMGKDAALLQNAKIDLKRYQELWDQNSIPKQQLDTQASLVRQYEATVKADQGQIDSAKLQLTYCRITAPVEGRIGLRLVDPGNMVHAADTNGLIVITQVQPITVIFPIPEDSLPQVVKRLLAGARLPVEAYDRDMRQKLADGVLATVDNQIDTTTGTVKLKAEFSNKRNELFPNQFVNARLLVDVLRDAVVVPAAAIQRGQQGSFVYLVKDDKTVDVRPVQIGEATGAETVVTSGLAAGEKVVVEGAERLRQGARVEIKGEGGATGNGNGSGNGNG